MPHALAPAMSERPTKRLKTLVLHPPPSSDAEAATAATSSSTSKEQSLPPSTRTRSKRTSSTKLTEGQASRAPASKDPRARRSKPAPKAAAAPSINSFFLASTFPASTARSQSSQPIAIDAGEPEDAIEDDDVDEAGDAGGGGDSGQEQHGGLGNGANGLSYSVKNGTERQKLLQKSSQRETGRLLAGSQKFAHGWTNNRLVAGDRGGTPSAVLDSRERVQDCRPWVDKYAPRSIDELAVHPKKVEDVRRWILETFAGRSRKVILYL